MSPDILKAGMRTCVNPADWASAIEAACARYEITTPARQAAFLAQIAYESQETTRLIENLNYSAARLVAVWPHRFPSIESATPFAMNSQALAEHVYSSRDGNGAEGSGDGWKYRGRGLIMTTFHDGYARVQAATGLQVLMCPDILLTKGAAAVAAALFWSDHGLNALADADRFDEITGKVNGAQTGAPIRRQYFEHFKQLLGTP